MKGHGGGLDAPVLGAERGDDDFRAERAPDAVVEVLQAHRRQPAFDDEKMLGRVGRRPRIELQETVAQEAAQLREPGTLSLRERLLLRVQPPTRQRDLLEPRLDRRHGAQQVRLADPRRRREFLDARRRQQGGHLGGDVR